MNTRKTLPDLLKGMAVLFMVQVHIMELFMKQEVFDGWLGKASLFLGGPPTAPVFVAVMGYFLARPSLKPAQILLRGLKLLLWGLLLNIGLNLHILFDIVFKEVPLNPWHFIFGIDILFLAGMSLIIISFFKWVFRDLVWAYLALAVVAASLGNVIPDYKGSIQGIPFILAFFGGGYTWSYFPVLPWLAYPLLGFCMYLLEKKMRLAEIPERQWSVLLGILTVAVLATLLYGVGIAHDLPAYYHHGLAYFVWVLFFLIWWVLLLKKLNHFVASTAVGKYIQWLGKNVTVVYVFQWLLIGNVATQIYKTQQSWTFPLYIVAVLLIASGFTWLYKTYFTGKKGVLV